MEAGGSQQQPSNRRRWAFVVVVILALVFIIQDSQEVQVEFLFFGRAQAPLIIALAITCVLGFLAGWLTARMRRGRE